MNMKKRKPEASAKKGTHYVTIAGGETTYRRNVYVSTYTNYVPSRRGIIDCTKSNPWERIPAYIQEQYNNHIAENMVAKFGMNEKLHDWTFPE